MEVSEALVMHDKAASYDLDETLSQQDAQRFPLSIRHLLVFHVDFEIDHLAPRELSLDAARLHLCIPQLGDYVVEHRLNLLDVVFFNREDPAGVQVRMRHKVNSDLAPVDQLLILVV